MLKEVEQKERSVFWLWVNDIYKCTVATDKCKHYGDTSKVNTFAGGRE